MPQYLVQEDANGDFPPIDPERDEDGNYPERLILKNRETMASYAKGNEKAWEEIPDGEPVPNTDRYNDEWLREVARGRARGWGEEVLSKEVSECIPEAYEDKYDFPDYDETFFKFLERVGV